jgi:DNA-binding transcriptional LysR family regulator
VRLSEIDLNLFAVFDAIYRERGITPASKRLHLSQPAVSHALARLRELVDDPLFERRGNDMVPTPLARTLATTVGRSLSDLEQLVSRLGAFEPATSRRRFALGLRPAQELSLLPALAETFAREAPNIELAFVRIDRRALTDQLESGELDAAIDVSWPLGPTIRRKELDAENFLVLARRGHPTIDGALDLSTYLAAEHVLVTSRRHGGGYEDAALAQLGATRRIRIRCQQHAAASEVVGRTDLLLTMHRTCIRQINRRSKHQVLPFPAEIPPMAMYLYWPAAAADDPAGKWFRGVVSEAFARRR